MNLDLKGKVALVTGSSKGIGKSIAVALHEEGCNVVLNSRHKSELKSTSKTLENSLSFSADMTNPKDCKKTINQLIKHFGRLDILVCNVGSGKSVPHGKETIEEYNRMLNVNLFSAINIIHESKKFLEKSNGSVICISSIAGIEFTGAPIPYLLSKAALDTYVKSISKPFAKHGIRINAVAPGNIYFKGSVWEKNLKKDPSVVKKMLKNEVALNRFGTPMEVANLVTYLASPKSSFITGSIFVIDGGQIKRL